MLFTKERSCYGNVVLRIALNLFAAFAVLTVALVAVDRSATAADLAEQAHSLRKVPADSAFYSASLRLKEQWDIFVGSKAYSKLMQIPLVQLAKMQASFQWQQSNEPTIAQVRDYFDSPAGKDGIDVLHEMFSDEIFAYGSSNIADTIKLFMELNSMARTARVQAAAEGEDSHESAEQKMVDALTKKLSHGLKVPTVVVGFRIKDQKRARANWTRFTR